VRRALEIAPLVAVVLGVIAAGSRLMGAPLSGRLLVLLGAGAVVAQAFPAHRKPIAVVVGALGLAAMNPVFSVYFLALLAGLALARRHALPFVVLLAGAAVWWPKNAFLHHYHEPGYWNWLNEPSLALALFMSASWFRARADARRAGAGGPGAGAEPDTISFLLLYLFPSHVSNPMIFSPESLFRPDRADARATAKLAGWFAAKAVALALLRRLGPHALLRGLGPADVGGLTFAGAWGVVAASYVEACFALAASADVPVLIARLYGWQLPDPFRAPLLAWNPVELWRRWGIYNRSFLLRLVYFPLGGNRRHRYRNVVLTFLASALVLHSGWLGSKYWEVGTGGWRDYTLYFMAQALAVCACLAFWERTGKDATSDRALRFSPGRVAGTVATQAWSALAHVLVLAQGIDLAARARVIGRCLGF
jgi:hypothetical protein